MRQSQPGAHALFMPHGLGHMMGLDVHDMEALGEDYVGYNDEIKRSKQFGLAFPPLCTSLQTRTCLYSGTGMLFYP